MTINEIKELIQLIDQTSINDFQYQKDGYKIKIRKSGGEAQAFVPGVGTQTQKPDGVQMAAANAKETPLAEIGSQAQAVASTQEVLQEVSAAKVPVGKEVKSPLVGVYYASPSPTSPAFVQVGSPIKKGDVICIVEAMKIMNEIVAEQDGIITEICAENETLVEYGQTLVRIG